MLRSLLTLIGRKPDVIPTTEPVNHVECRHIVRGSSYLVKEPRPEISVEIFKSLVLGKCPDCIHPEAFPCESIGCEDCTLSCMCKKCKHVRAQGLCFTMRSPDAVRHGYTLQTTPIFWISNHGADSISPGGLELIANMINSFLNRSKNPVILLDGAEYMIAINGFIPVLKLLRDIQEWTILNNAIFLLPLNPSSIEEKELALIERNMNELAT